MLVWRPIMILNSRIKFVSSMQTTTLLLLIFFGCGKLTKKANELVVVNSQAPFNITENIHAPILTKINNLSHTVGISIGTIDVNDSQTGLDQDEDGDKIIYQCSWDQTVNDLPDSPNSCNLHGFNFNVDTGILSGAPTQNGTYEFSIKGSDGKGKSDFIFFVLDVSEVINGDCSNKEEIIFQLDKPNFSVEFKLLGNGFTPVASFSDGSPDLQSQKINHVFSGSAPYEASIEVCPGHITEISFSRYGSTTNATVSSLLDIFPNKLKNYSKLLRFYFDGHANFQNPAEGLSGTILA